jgi:hypothetical protein
MLDNRYTDTFACDDCDGRGYHHEPNPTTDGAFRGDDCDTCGGTGEKAVTTTTPVTYLVEFVPSDANVHPDECYTAQTFRSKTAAQMAVAEDCRSESASITANGGSAYEWQAYALTGAHALSDALSDSPNHDAFPVDVRHGDNPRRIGIYLIRTLRLGSIAPCTTCGANGTVTDMAEDGSDFVACCDYCRAEDERDTHETARISTPPHAYIATPDNLQTGQRVIFTRNVTRYPFVTITKGETGTVTEVSADAISITLDTRHEGLDEWDNALQICIPDHDIDDTDALSVI